VNPETEQQIRRRIRDDDPAALDLLYDTLGARLYHYALGILRSPQSAEDVVQDLFLDLVDRRGKVGKARNMTAYVFAMLRHRALKLLRRERRVPDAPCDVSELLASMPAPSGDGAGDMVRHAMAELGRLPLKQREVIWLKIFERMTFADVSHHLGISLNTAGSRYRYGMDKLRRSLRRYDQ
jgi:RNA polymerase sigma-70 factor (ECF subfamily)